MAFVGLLRALARSGAKEPVVGQPACCLACQPTQIELDLRAATLLVHTPVDGVAVLRQAEKLGAAHAEALGGRSADLFHVAAAVELGLICFCASMNAK